LLLTQIKYSAECIRLCCRELRKQMSNRQCRANIGANSPLRLSICA